jgi:hypothetical protein
LSKAQHGRGQFATFFGQNGDHLTWGYIAKGPTWKRGQFATFFGQYGDHLTWGYIGKGPTWKGKIFNIFGQNGDHLFDKKMKINYWNNSIYV